MKHRLLKFLVAMFIILGPYLSGKAQQVIVNIHLPPVGYFTVEDIYHAVHLTNTGFEPCNLFLHATVRLGNNDKLIFDGETSVFMAEPGVVPVTPDRVESLRVIQSDPDYEGLLIQTGSIPAGIYIICVEVVLAGTEEILSKDCVEHEVSHPSMPQLLMPANEAVVSEPFPLFNWLPPMPLPVNQMVTYRIKVVEILDGQNPYEAIESNPAWFKDENIDIPQVIYPMDARELQPGIYAWQVQSVDRNGLPVGMNDGKSEVFTFSTERIEGRYIHLISPVMPCVGSISETAFTTGRFLNIQWQYSGNFDQFEVVVYDNPCGQYPVPPSTPVPPPGEPTPPPTPPGEPGKTTPPAGPGVPTGRSPTPVPRTPGTTITPTPVSPGDAVTDSIKPGGITPVPDIPEGNTDLPPLPPGWKWGPSGPTWTGEHPPEPPALPPGWEWGPLRPVWTGEGEPPPRKVLGFSEPVKSVPVTIVSGESIFENISLDLSGMILPGHAFIYQVYGSGTEKNGQRFAVLSEPQCMRFMGSETDEVTPVPAPCPGSHFCHVRIEEKVEPRMSGGLDPPEQEHHIYRDEYVPLKADGKDFDQMWWHCDPIKPCPDTYSSEMRNLTGRVKYTWDITKGEGNFVELGCISKKRSDEGIRTIFMPPYVEIDSLKETEIKLTIIDDNPTQPLDSDVVVRILVQTRRKKDDPDRYDIRIKSDKYQLPQPVQLTGLPLGTCLRQGPKWDQDKDLKNPPGITLPDVPDKDKLVFKEWIRLEASDIRDPDLVKVWCTSKKCQTNDAVRTYEDEVEWTWKINSGGGRFITGNTGRFVIYEAPEAEGEVEIQVEAYNNVSLQIVDVKSPPGKIKFRVYQPGVKLELTDLSWLPENNKELQKKSWLVHREGNEWKPPFEHQCRIHFFEFPSYSTEKGVCLNWPEPAKSDNCPDLAVKKDNGYEAFDSLRCRKYNTRDTTYYLKARSKLPEKERTITVKCEDYGAYGFMRSLANGTKDASTPYLSVPWKKTEVPHPDGREKKTQYGDNRVTIPRDCDENKIADNGWISRLQALINSYLVTFRSQLKEKDPVDPLVDNDRIPVSNTNGDGLSAYEEYRGFMVKGVHHRTNVGFKDLFIHDRDNIGIGNLGKTGILAHRIHRNEFSQARVINFNHSTNAQLHLGFLQHGLLLVDASADATMANLYGIAAGGPGPPRVIDSIKINVTLNNTNGRPLGRSIAHEICHGLDVWHHGSGQINGRLAPGDTVFIDADTIVNRTAGNFIYTIACQKGLFSGDVDCWMRYTHRYCPVTPALKNLDCSNASWNSNLASQRLTRQDFVYGDNITDVVNGTGVNAGGNCGQDAANVAVGTNPANRSGMCCSQIRIRDQ